ncbi:hypothetical protein NPIL_466811, partial [Nephila pilipes]
GRGVSARRHHNQGGLGDLFGNVADGVNDILGGRRYGPGNYHHYRRHNY